MIELVVGDVHARAKVLRALLKALGVLDSRGRRRDGYWIVQVGDLLDRRASPEANLETARLAAQSMDVVLAGNHEITILSESAPKSGAALATLAGRGWPQAAAAMSGWLVTHAGIHPELTHGLPRQAELCAIEINDRWHRRPHQALADPLFDWVGGAKGGVAPYGGIFWRSEREWPPRGRTPWGQICGHAPQARPRLLPGPRWMIDVGGRRSQLAALVRQDGEDNWSAIVVCLSAGGVAVARNPSKPVATLAA